MSALKNVLALIGLISLVVVLVVAIKVKTVFNVFDTFDEKAVDIYSEFILKAYESGSAIDAMVHKVKVQRSVSAEELDDSIHSIANELNIKTVGELPLSDQVQAMSGKAYRYVKIYLLCNAMTAANMLNFSDGFSSFLPCRISVVEDEKGTLWLYTLNLDLLIYGGKPIPPALKDETIRIRDALTEIMHRAAIGDF